MTAYTWGVLAGILVGVIVAVILLLVMHSDKKVKCRFDERQEIQRGKAYKVGFYTMLIYFAIYGCVLKSSDLFLPVEDAVGAFIGIILGVSVFAIRCILSGAYFALNEKPGNFMLLFGICGGLNLFIAMTNDDPLIRDGKLAAYPGINLLCGIFMLVLLAVLVVKWICTGNEAENE